MGHTTGFDGQFTVTPPLKPGHIAYLQAFNGSRRLSWNEKWVSEQPDPLRAAAGLPVGQGGCFYVAGGTNPDWIGHKDKSQILDYNNPPADQPGLWCQWTPTDDGTAIEWDTGEKFYAYTEWLEYLIANFLVPWGYSITGQVSWIGESSEDRGIIYAVDNRVEAVEDVITNPGPSR